MAGIAVTEPATAPAAAAPARPGFWQRAVAFAVDWSIVSLPAQLLQSGQAVQPVPRPPDLEVGRALGALGITLVLALLYFAYFWSGQGGGRTWGMRVLGLRVTREDGSPIDLGRSLIRSVGLLISFVAVGLGVIWVAIDPKKQGWHDKFSGSVVVPDAAPAYPRHAVEFSMAPPRDPQRFWAIPVLGILVKLVALIPVAFALLFTSIGAAVVYLVVWLAVLFVGRYPAWAAGFMIWLVRWSTHVAAFVYGLTDRYPWPSTALDQPVQLAVERPEASSRLWAIPLVGFLLKVVVLVPAYALLSFASSGAGLALLVAWVPVLAGGTYPDWVARFLTATLRWNARMSAYLLGVTDAYPGAWDWER